MSESTRQAEYLPGGSLPESQLFEVRLMYRAKTTPVEVGVTDPSGRFRPFLDGESFVFVRKDPTKDRQLFIRRRDGTMVKFGDWVQGFEMQPQGESVWGYDPAKGLILDPNGKKRDTDSLSLEELRTICIEIRSKPYGNKPSWPSDVAQAITERYLSLKKQKKS